MHTKIILFFHYCTVHIRNKQASGWQYSLLLGRNQAAQTKNGRIQAEAENPTGNMNPKYIRIFEIRIK